MKNIKNNITFKYTIGLSLVTIFILSIQIGIIKLFDTIGFGLTGILLIITVIVMPLVSLYIVTKVSCKKSPDINLTYLLTKIFIISIVLTILSAIFLGLKFGMFGNIDDKMLVISGGSANIITKSSIKYYEETPLITFGIIGNIKTIIKLLTVSTLYIGGIILVLVRYWINNMQSEKKEFIKQIKLLLIAITVIIMLEILANVGVNIIQGNIQISMTILLESNVTDREKEEIENKLKEMDEIISYRYMDISEVSNELIESMEEDFGYDNLFMEDIKDRIDTIIKNEKFDLTVYNKNVDSIKEALEGMNGIKKIQGMSIEV